MSVDCYRDLIVWQKAMDLVVICYEITKGFPLNEVYGLTSQLKRAAVSIPANIGEGYGKHGLGEYIHFLGIAQSSLRETETLLLIAKRLNFISAEELNNALTLSTEISKMIAGLTRSLRNKQN
ncbi:MAG TPA: four helix bundle protein [Pyrinomonadaceae bacterium]|nr:four helix bundle protein [Pyrinomonadaceae bacterium]